MTRTCVTILGCGPSAGVPIVGRGWGACDSQLERNSRTRCSILVHKTMPHNASDTLEASTKGLSVLVDTSTDARVQLLKNAVNWIDAVCITHPHADHVHGIDELKHMALVHKMTIPVYASRSTCDDLYSRFTYCFKPPYSDPEIRPLYALNPIDVRQPIMLNANEKKAIQLGIEMEMIEVQHGRSVANGFIFDRSIGYIPDVNAIDNATCERLRSLDLLILDALRYRKSASHFSVNESLAMIDHLAPREAILTNLDIELDYLQVSKELPENVKLAYDGMQWCSKSPTQK